MHRDKFSTAQEAEKAIELAIGRLYSLGARPTKPGDLAQYYFCRGVILDAVTYLGTATPTNKAYQELYYNHIYK